MGRKNILSFIVLCLILTSTYLKFKADGRPEPNSPVSTKRGTEDKAIMVRGQIGSRPPRCERRCSSCGHCEAIQVPTNPRNVKTNITDSSSSSSAPSVIINLDHYIRGDDSSNYKPMSWKCKCGSSIFNP